MSDTRDYFDKVTVDTVENDQYESRTKTKKRDFNTEKEEVGGVEPSRNHR